MKPLLTLALCLTLMLCLAQSASKQVVLNQPTMLFPGSENTIVGEIAGNPNGKGNPLLNVVIGKEAGFSLFNGQRNLLIGANAGRNLTDGKNNIFLGLNAGWENKTGENNIVIGSASIPNATNNIILGREGSTMHSLRGNVIIGRGNLKSQTEEWSRNVIIGDEAAGGFLANVGSTSVIIGASAGTNATRGGIMIGAFAGEKNKASNVLIIGHSSGAKNTRNGNLLIGHQAAEFADLEECLIIGNHAIRPNKGINGSKSDRCVFVGNHAGQEDVKSGASVYLGSAAGAQFAGGLGNVFIGNAAGHSQLKGDQEIPSSKGDHNTFLGTSSGLLIDNMSDNVFVGYESGRAMPLGEGNVFMGTFSGNTITTRTDHVILIGHNAQAKEGIKNAVGIGTNVNVVSDQTLVLGNAGMKVGIGTNQPNSSLEINAGSPNTSGLRFTNLNNTSTAVKAGNTFLSVDQNGNVILTEVTKCKRAKMGRCCVSKREIENIKSENTALKVQMIEFQRQLDLLKS